MAKWKKIDGDEALRLADAGIDAMPGTVSTLALQWIGQGTPPSAARFAAVLTCRYCATTLPLIQIVALVAMPPRGRRGSVPSRV